MKLARQRVRTLARERGFTLTEALRRARVSRNAFYHLARRATVVPRSVHALGAALGVTSAALLDEAPLSPEARAAALLSEARFTVSQSRRRERPTCRARLPRSAGSEPGRPAEGRSQPGRRMSTRRTAPRRGPWSSVTGRRARPVLRARPRRSRRVGSGVAGARSGSRSRPRARRWPSREPGAAGTSFAVGYGGGS